MSQNSSADAGAPEPNRPDTDPGPPRRAADEHALERLFRDAYDELCEIARAQRRRWRGNETLNTHALVHELYIKLSRQDPPLRNPAALYAVASRAMRHLLVNYAERQAAEKRGGDVDRVPLATLGPTGGPIDPAGASGSPATAEEVLALNAALDRLGALSDRQKEVVECRFFGGLTVDETAAALQVSTATVKRDWRMARAWLQRELRSEPAG